MTLFQRVEKLTVTSQNSSKKSIGEFVLRKKSHVSKYTTQQIADETYTSKAALVRFAKALGYQGWKEFAEHSRRSSTIRRAIIPILIRIFHLPATTPFPTLSGKCPACRWKASWIRRTF